MSHPTGGTRARGATPPRESASRAAETGGIRLGTWQGVAVEADWGALALLALASVQGAGLLARWHPAWSPNLVWTVAATGGVLFFVAIGVHEIAHAVAARAWDLPMRRVTLYAFGGCARLDREPPSPRAELAVATAGPLVSLALATAAATATWFLAGVDLATFVTHPDDVVREGGPLVTLVAGLAVVSAALAALNVVPAFPLDGGRALRAALWRRSGAFFGATRSAVAAGTAFGNLVLAAGIVAIGAGLLEGGVWLVLLGWSLRSAARGAYDALVVDHALAQLSVEDLMRQGVDVVTPHTTLDELLESFLAHPDQLELPVVRGGRLVGLVGVGDLRRAPRGDWAGTMVESVMTPVERLVTLERHASASDALATLAHHELEQLAIVEDGRLRGMVRRREILRWIGTMQLAIPG